MTDLLPARHPAQDDRDDLVAVAAVLPCYIDGRDERLRRLDRRIAAAVAIAATTMFGTAAGLATRPFEDQVSDLVSDAQWWAIAGGVVATAAVVAAGWWLVRWWSRWWGGWWPYRHNRLLDTMPDKEVLDPADPARGGLR